jgi:hypothetical protein
VFLSRYQIADSPEENWRIKVVDEGTRVWSYLVYVDEKIAVVSDAQEPPATSVILPRASIGAIVSAK